MPAVHTVKQPACKPQTMKRVRFGHRTEAKEMYPRETHLLHELLNMHLLEAPTLLHLFCNHFNGEVWRHKQLLHLCFLLLCCTCTVTCGVSLYAGIPLITTLSALLHVHCSGHACEACSTFPAWGVALPHPSTSGPLPIMYSVMGALASWDDSPA